MLVNKIALVRNIKVQVVLDDKTDYDKIAVNKAEKVVLSSKYKNAINIDSGYIYKKSIPKFNLFWYTAQFLCILLRKFYSDICPCSIYLLRLNLKENRIQ